MGFFGFGKGSDIVDLTGDHQRMPKKKNPSISDSTDTDSDAMRILGGLNNSTENLDSNKDEEDEDKEEYQEFKKKKLSKKLGDITERLENLSNQIYHVEQRLEVIEKKMRISRED